MVTERKMEEADVKTLIQETQWVRKLLTLLALSSGYKQKHIAATLGVSEATMSRMMPKDLPSLHTPKH
jgi:DNA-binding transcriptional regulator LsrR (DeoR family)